MGFTKATMWMGMSISLMELWCEVLGQTWSDELEGIIWDFDNDIIFATQGNKNSYEEIQKFITNQKAWDDSLRLLENNGQKLKLVAHDQVDSGYVLTNYFIGHEFAESVSLEVVLIRIRQKDYPKGYRFYVLQDDCLCCT